VNPRLEHPSPDPSAETQRLEFGDVLAQGRFDTQMQRHHRARATSAHAGQPDIRRIAVHIDEHDVATVCLQEWPDSIEHCLNPFSGDHLALLQNTRRMGNGDATKPAPDLEILAGFST